MAKQPADDVIDDYWQAELEDCLAELTDEERLIADYVPNGDGP
jgi:hypothetical protein